MCWTAFLRARYLCLTPQFMRWRRLFSPRDRIFSGYRAVTKDITSFPLLASTTHSNDRNLRTILELLKPPDKSFASKVINFGVVNVHMKIQCKLSRLRHHILFSQRIVYVTTPLLYCSKVFIRLHLIIWSIIFKVTSSRSWLNKILVIRGSASFLMNSEIATLFIRSAIKYSLQKKLLLLCLPERVLVFEEKNSGFLWQEFRKLRFCS